MELKRILFTYSDLTDLLVTYSEANNRTTHHNHDIPFPVFPLPTCLPTHPSHHPLSLHPPPFPIPPHYGAPPFSLPHLPFLVYLPTIWCSSCAAPPSTIPHPPQYGSPCCLPHYCYPVTLPFYPVYRPFPYHTPSMSPPHCPCSLFYLSQHSRSP